MLDQVNLQQTVTKEEYKKQGKDLKPALSALQQPLKKAKLPVIILFEGWGAAGKGSLISSLILNFDPRGFQVHSISAPEEREKRRPVLWRHWLDLPEQGIISVLDRSWYQEVSVTRLEQNLADSSAIRRMADINSFEHLLTDGGYLILKFFLHIGKEEQKARFDRLEQSKNTAWRVTEVDRRRNRQYDKYYKVYDEMLEYTNTEYAPWHVVSATDRRSATLEIYRTVLDRVQSALKQREEKAVHLTPAPGVILPGDFPLVSMPKLADVRLNEKLGKEKYKEELDVLQERLGELHSKLYRKRVPVIIAYEGWDAAGKGGNIRRVAKALDPRGYEVVPIAAPSQQEAARHYLWRFWRKLPKDGHIAIFDRTWYGRVLVERIEGFTPPEDWQRAYREINDFERQLNDWGAVVIKFWLQIDKDEQLKRFQNRQNTPSKQWKITDEDWRNREKWDQYEIAVNDMLQYTSTEFAPWHIIPSQDKNFGRIQTLQIITNAIQQRLDSNEKQNK